MFKLGFMGQGLYVSPDRDLVIVYFSTNPDTNPGQRYMRPIAKSGLFN
jgi:CubicO group peptidase (beta-lactamase class C family)